MGTRDHYSMTVFHSIDISKHSVYFFLCRCECANKQMCYYWRKRTWIVLKNVHFNLVQFVKHFSHFYFINEGVLRRYCNSLRRQEYIYRLNDGTGSLNTTLTAKKRKCNFRRCQSCSHRTSLTLK